MMGVHPNTVRLYEELGLISRAKREENGYRSFTQLHVEQFQLARTALQVEVLQNGLRKEAVEIIKATAAEQFDLAIELTKGYLSHIKRERENAEEAVEISKQLLSGELGEVDDEPSGLTRRQVADHLKVSVDTLRNWEMNGLLTVRRRENGYRIYRPSDVQRLKVIRALRCANYSLESILRMVNSLTQDDMGDVDIKDVLDTPRPDDDVISVCDQLLTSLSHAADNAHEILKRLEHMKAEFGPNPTL